MTLVVLVVGASVAANHASDAVATVIRAGAGALAVLALIHGPRHHQATHRSAWSLLATGVGVWVVGDALWDGLEAAGQPSGSPWFLFANVLYLLTYPVLFAAVISLAGPGGHRGNLDNIIDCTLLSLAAVLTLRMFVVPATPTGDTLEEVLSSAIPFGDALLLGGIAWLLFSSRGRNPSLWLLTAGLAVMLGADIIWDLQTRLALTDVNAWLDPAYPLAYALIGAAALHPAVAKMDDGNQHASHFGPWARLVFLSASMAVVFAVALLGTRDDLVIQGAVVALVIAIEVRFAALVGHTQQAYLRADASDSRFRLLATAVPAGIYEISRDQEVVFANRELELLVGKGVVGLGADDLLPLATDPAEGAALAQAHRSLLAGCSAAVNVRIRVADGRDRWIAWRGTPAREGAGPFGGAFVSAIDITALKEAEALLSLQATHDPLTLLPNRRLLLDRLAGALGRMVRRPGMLAVFFLDLDRFKQVNDRLGHEAGDDLLKVVADRLVKSVRAQDTVARFGGDEFVVILENVAGRDEVAIVAQKVIGRISAPVLLGASSCDIGASIGIAVSSDPRADPDALLRDADTAMYAAKEHGHGGYQFSAEPAPGEQARTLRAGEPREPVA